MYTLSPEERELIEELYRRYNAKLFRVAAASFYNNEALAEDSVSQTFLIACRNPQKIINHPAPEAWLLNVLHKVISHEKRRRAIYLALLIGILPLIREDTTESNLELEDLYPGLIEMPEFQLVKWFAVDGLSIAEIAEKLDISISACKKRLERARKTLAEILNE